MIPTFTLLLTWALITVAAGDGILSLQLKEYVNPGGKRASRKCCDDIFFGLKCSSKCDHFFFICADVIGGSGAHNSCGYGRVKTATTKNKNDIVFGRHIGSPPTPNPINFSFTKWEDLRLKVQVWDADRINDDLVENLANTLRKRPSKSTSRLVLRGRTKLVLDVTVSCASNFFGYHCDVKCVATPTFTCDPDTGNKICNPGYTGPNCETHIITTRPTRRPTPPVSTTPVTVRSSPWPSTTPKPTPIISTVPSTTPTVPTTIPTTAPSSSPSPTLSSTPPTKTCYYGQFLCRRSKKCIPKAWVCDQEQDCTFGEDELGCPPPSRRPWK